jgi:hypothetical protein
MYESLLNTICTSEEDELDVNGNVINHQDFNVSTNLSVYGYVSQLLLSGSYNGFTEYVDVWLANGESATQTYVAEDYVADDYTLDSKGTTLASARLTEKKRVKINNDCRENPVYLMWKNSLGGWDYWLFDNRSETSYKAKTGTNYNVYNQDIERETRRSMVVENRQMKTIVVGDSVTKEDIIGLVGIEKSSAVYMLYDATKLATDPELAWMMIDINPLGFKYVNQSNLIDVEVSFNVIEFYNVPN